MTERDEFDLAFERLAARTASWASPPGSPIGSWPPSSAQHELDATALSSFEVVELEQ